MIVHFFTQFEPLPSTISFFPPQNKSKKKIPGRRTDIGDGRSHTDLDTRVALLSQLALEELVQLGIEDTVGDELSALRDSSLDSGHDCCVFGWWGGGRVEEGVVDETAGD